MKKKMRLLLIVICMIAMSFPVYAKSSYRVEEGNITVSLPEQWTVYKKGDTAIPSGVLRDGETKAQLDNRMEEYDIYLYAVNPNTLELIQVHVDDSEMESLKKKYFEEEDGILTVTERRMQLEMQDDSVLDSELHIPVPMNELYIIWYRQASEKEVFMEADTYHNYKQISLLYFPGTDTISESKKEEIKGIVDSITFGSEGTSVEQNQNTVPEVEETVQPKMTKIKGVIDLEIFLVIPVLVFLVIFFYRLKNRKREKEPSDVVSASKKATVTQTKVDRETKPVQTQKKSQSDKDAIKRLRDEIIEKITKTPKAEYELASLLWGDAARCFPTGASFQWEVASFMLNLKTRKLYAKVGTYPDAFGAAHTDSYSLTASLFYEIAVQFNMRPVLQTFKTEEDWEMLFDEKLKAVVSDVCLRLEKEEEERKQEKIRKNMIVIPDDIANLSPDMDIVEMVLALRQRYGIGEIKLTQENGQYHIVNSNYSFLSSEYNSSYSRKLTSKEGAWVEMKVSKVKNDPDNSTWESIPGGDRMDIIIKTTHRENVEFHSVKPFNKYKNLMYGLEKLAQYGSR